MYLDDLYKLAFMYQKEAFERLSFKGLKEALGTDVVSETDEFKAALNSISAHSNLLGLTEQAVSQLAEDKNLKHPISRYVAY